MSGKEKRYKAWVKHNVSKSIIDSCEAGDIIVMGDLKGIRKNKGRRFNFWLHGWSFYQLQDFIKYKATRKGIQAVKISPYLTSQTCSQCEDIGTRSKGFFLCSHCGYSLNADLNASFNLAKRNSMSDYVSVVVSQPDIPDDESKAIVNGVAEEFRNNQLSNIVVFESTISLS